MPSAARWSERPHLFGMPQPVASPVQCQLLPGTGQCPLHPLKHVKGGGLLGGMNETPVQGRFSGSVMWFVHSISPDKNHAVGQRGVNTRSCAGPLSAVAVFLFVSNVPLCDVCRYTAHVRGVGHRSNSRKGRVLVLHYTQCAVNRHCVVSSKIGSFKSPTPRKRWWSTIF